MRLSIRTIFYLVFCYAYALVCVQAAADASGFDEQSTVWRKKEDQHLLDLRGKLLACPPAGKHNRAIARLVVQGDACPKDFPTSPRIQCYISNHAHVDESVIRIDDERVKRERNPQSDDGAEEPAISRPPRAEGGVLQLSRECVEKGYKDARKAVPDDAVRKLKSGMPWDTPGDVSAVESFCDVTIQQLTAVRARASELRALRVAEELYRKFYPFVATHKNRMLDSEVSMCRDIDAYLSSNKPKPESIVFLYVHTDNNPCFCCVQTMHHFAKKWAQDFQISLVVLVSSDKEYVWSGDLPPPHIVPNGLEGKPSMREYGRDAQYDQPLLAPDQCSQFQYAKDRVGKVIQVFIPVQSANEAAAK